MGSDDKGGASEGDRVKEVPTSPVSRGPDVCEDAKALAPLESSLPLSGVYSRLRKLARWGSRRQRIRGSTPLTSTVRGRSRLEPAPVAAWRVNSQALIAAAGQVWALRAGRSLPLGFASVGTSSCATLGPLRPTRGFSIGGRGEIRTHVG